MTTTESGGLDALLDAAVDAIIIIDAQGLITAFNPAAVRMFRYPASEVHGRNVTLLMPEPHRSLHDEYIQRFTTTREARIIGIGREVTARRKDGTAFPVYLSVGEIRDGGYVGILRDETDRRAMLERLRQREEQLGLVFERAPLGTATYDREGRFLSVNQAFCTMLGYTQDALLEMGIRAITHPDEVDGAERRIRQVFEGTVDAYRLEIRYLRKDGSIMYGMLHAGVVHGADDEPVMLVAQVEDRTRQREADEEARQQRERLAHVGRVSTIGEMAAGLAHEINQPLTAIANYAKACKRMVENGQGGLGELTEALDKIAAQAERAGEVIKRLRGMIRRRDSQSDQLDVNELVREVIGLSEADARANGIRLRLELTPGLPAVTADPVQIQQVLLNLVRNAIDATLDQGDDEQHPPITIRTALDDEGKVKVSVVDAGTGMTDEAASRIFTPFFTTKPEGLGLGLPICRNIVEAYGGELRFERLGSERTEFWFTLPPHEG